VAFLSPSLSFIHHISVPFSQSADEYNMEQDQDRVVAVLKLRVLLPEQTY
jgi:hypothetical protein